jgi:hypothetical protein
MCFHSRGGGIQILLTSMQLVSLKEQPEDNVIKPRSFLSSPLEKGVQMSAFHYRSEFHQNHCWHTARG